jgi:crossover junction endodeoxyribonuclease RusA
VIELTFPPSVNALSRAYNGRIISSEEHRTWAKTAAQELMVQRPKKHTGPVSVSILLGPPHKRQFDIDNRAKAILDALVKAQVIETDSISCVQELSIKLGQGFVGARITVTPL